ncbi:MAG TPA: hypothetical protein VK181_19600, partial [Rhizobium sp.]|nr:hypothetical protein [Rhizobium sp.]
RWPASRSGSLRLAGEIRIRRAVAGSARSCAPASWCRGRLVMGEGREQPEVVPIAFNDRASRQAVCHAH